MMALVIRDFEGAIADYLQVPYTNILVCNSGSSALFVTLLATIKPGELVITSPFTFPATVNAILLAGGIPVFVDIGENYQLDLELVKKYAAQYNVGTVVWPTLFQKPMPEMPEQLPFKIIEDAAQCFFPSKNKNVSFRTFSFYKTKRLSTFEGGAIYCKDYLDIARLGGIINQGQQYPGEFVSIGLNFRMPEILAQIGLEALKTKRFNLTEKQPEDGYYDYVIQDLRYMKDYDYIDTGTPKARETALKIKEKKWKK